jgi:LacI family transcriptional regulator
MGLSKKQSRNVTIADVARAAGVAPMTVSRTINGYPHIKPATAMKVREAIERLSYSPNLAARMLMGQRSNSIGLVIPDLKNPFFAVVADGVQAATRARGALVWIVASNADATVERQEIEKLLSYHVDGILIIPSEPGQPYLRKLLSGTTPIVAIDLPINSDLADSVVAENRQSSYLAVQHLISHGYKNILCLGAWPDLFTMQERIAGYESAMQSVGLKPRISTDAQDAVSIKSALRKLLRGRSRPEAVFTLNQQTTEIALDVFDEMQIMIPDQIALIGFDDFPYASLLKPKITVVRQPASDLGQCAARRLFERLELKEKLPRMKTVLPSELVIRESCGCRENHTSVEAEKG